MNPFANIASGLNPTTSGISDSSLYGIASDDYQENQNNLSLIQSLIGQSSDESDAMSILQNLAMSDPAYMELWLRLKAERENYRQQWQDYIDYQKIAPGLTYQAYKDAGLNPWMALQNFGANIGSGSSASMGTFSSSGSTAAAKSALQSSKNDSSHIDRFISIFGTIIGALIGAMVLFG